jgi:glutamate 5-kinase
MMRERAVLKDARRVVVKVGTHSIACKTGRPDYAALKRVVDGIQSLREKGLEVVFVSSGAVAAGIEALGLKSRPQDVNDVQMCAAVGQARYITEYERLFADKGIQIGQVLLTHADFYDRRRAANVRRVIDHLVRKGIVPVINENDVVADEEIKGLTFGDNDWLSSLIAKLVCADALVLLTTVDGLLDETGKRVPEIVSVREALKLVKTDQKGALSKGGMDSKLKAVKNATEAGVNVVIANGRKKGVLEAVFSGKDTGTFVPGRAM